jgi:hypothetical protein
MKIPDLSHEKKCILQLAIDKKSCYLQNFRAISPGSPFAGDTRGQKKDYEIC